MPLLTSASNPLAPLRKRQNFREVIAACQRLRPGQDGTRIKAEMQAAYCTLHEQGHCHSVEA